MEHSLTQSPVKTLPPISQVTHSLLAQSNSHHPMTGYQPTKLFYTSHLQNNQNMSDFHHDVLGNDCLQPDYYMNDSVATLKQNSRFLIGDIFPKINFPFSPASPQEKPLHFYPEKFQEISGYAANHDIGNYQENQPTLYTPDYDDENYSSQKTEEDEERTLENLSEMEIDTGADTAPLPESSSDHKSSLIVASKPKKGSVTKSTAAHTKRPSKKKGSKQTEPEKQLKDGPKATTTRLPFYASTAS